MKYLLTVFCLSLHMVYAQTPVDLRNFSGNNGANVRVKQNKIFVSWPAAKKQRGQLVLDLSADQPLFHSLDMVQGTTVKQICKNLDPVFVLTVGKRDLVSQNGWNIFFDKVPLKPFQSEVVAISKQKAAVHSKGSRTVIRIDEIKALHFSGAIEITLYNGSNLFNVAAVMSTTVDSTAILYDAGFVSKEMEWNGIAWSDVYGQLQYAKPSLEDTSLNKMVKYRTIIGKTERGSVAVFPAPHQYFYPLDEAFNLRFTWHGNRYRKLIDGYGLGIRQDLYGDKRFVPWFNAPPSTEQRLNFFCMLSDGEPSVVLEEVKKFTHNDRYVALPGYKTMASHFHNEFIMNVVRANKPIPDSPSFVNVLKNLGVNMVHLGEFHYTAHPKGPDSLRLNELHALFDQCRRLSSKELLLLPGEEPNEFLGGHWMQIFPKPVYWVMSRKEGEPFVSDHPSYGKVYRIADKKEMLQLLQLEKGLAWTAHPRTKGSTGFPDKYKDEAFFHSPHFLGAAWKAMPADLSQPRLGKRVLDLMDDMHNWGLHKKVLAEADLFTIEPENEMYAHMNVNYLQLNEVPRFDDGWQPVVDAMQKGKFFSTTGEVLIPSFTVNNKGAGDTVRVDNNGTVKISFRLRWTFPLQFAEVISGDGTNVYRHKINLEETIPFGEKNFSAQLNMKGRKWMRLEVWDAAVNGAFTQTVWLQQ